MAVAESKNREFVLADVEKGCSRGKEMGSGHKWATTVRSLTQDCGRGDVKETVICPTPESTASSGSELPSRVRSRILSRRPESVPRLPPGPGKYSVYFNPECLLGNMRLFDVDHSSDFIINTYKYEATSDTSTKRMLIGEKAVNTMTTYKSMDRLREHRILNNGRKSEKEEDCESDSSEELQYGPGIVNKLKTKYLSLTLRENQRRGVRPSLNNLRRATSLENILDEEIKVSQPKTQAYFKKSTHNTMTSRNSKVSQYCARYMSINKGPDSMKRAQSMDALYRNEVKSVPSLPKSLTVDARLSNGNDVVIIDRAPQPPKPTIKSDVDKDLPPHDVVKQTLKIFEKSNSSNRKPDISSVPKVKAVKVLQERSMLSAENKRRPTVKPTVLPKPVLTPDRLKIKRDTVMCSTPPTPSTPAKLKEAFMFTRTVECPELSPIISVRQQEPRLAEATNPLVSEPALQSPPVVQRPPRPLDSPKQVAVIRPVVNKAPSPPPLPAAPPSPPQAPPAPQLTHVEIEKNLINRSHSDAPVADDESPKISLWDAKAWNGQNTVVFDFSNRKEIPDYIENDGLVVPAKKDKKVNGELSLEEEDLVDSPLSCHVSIIGGNIVINGKSNLRKQPKQQKLRIQFDKAAPALFEYPREEGDETPTSPTSPASGLLPSSGGSLCSYIPSKTVDRFELGISRSPIPTNPKSSSEGESVMAEPPPPWSSHEASSDILF